MGWASSGFEIGNTLDKRSYPAPRLKRTGPDPSLTAADAEYLARGSAIPRVRVFPIVIQANLNARSTTSTPRLRGNIVILDWALHMGAPTDPPAHTMEFGYALNPVTETNVALTTIRPYTMLIELLDRQNIVAADRGEGFPFNTMNSPNRIQNNPLGLIITESEAAVTVSIVNPAGNAGTFHGYIRVVEALSREALARGTGVW